jgi:hypothetical protein
VDPQLINQDWQRAGSDTQDTNLEIPSGGLTETFYVGCQRSRRTMNGTDASRDLRINVAAANRQITSDNPFWAFWEGQRRGQKNAVTVERRLNSACPSEVATFTRLAQIPDFDSRTVVLAALATGPSNAPPGPSMADTMPLSSQSIVASMQVHSENHFAQLQGNHSNMSLAGRPSSA